MTTIAYRDGILAADTGVTAGRSRLGNVAKIARREDGALAAVCGGAAFGFAFLTWFRDRSLSPAAPPPELKEDKDSMDAAAIFYPDGSIELFEPQGRFPVEAPYFARGSGRPEALGAMHHGASAEEAIRAAMAHDDSTWGDVMLLTHEVATEAVPLRVVKG